MAIRKTPPAVAPKQALAPRGKTRLFARLRGGHGHGDSLTVPFGAPALLSGRLTRADGAGVSGRELRVVARPSHGALAPTTVAAVSTGERGGFELRLESGPSRRLDRQLPRRRRPRGGQLGPRSSSGSAPGSPSPRRRCRCGPVRRCGSAAGSAAAARRSRGAASWSRSSTWRRRRGAGARSSSPAPITAAASAPTTASATSTAPPRFACARPPWPRSAGPTRRAPRAR